MSDILITGAKTALGLRLAKAFEQEQLLLADYGDVPQLTTASYRLKSMGACKKSALAHQLLALCLDWGVKLLVPVYLEEMMALSKSLTLFEEYGIEVLCPKSDVLQTYLPMQVQADWLVIRNGNLHYSTLPQLQLPDNAAQNGVFFVDSNAMKLSLMHAFIA